MVLLDSDHMSLLQRGGVEGTRIARRLRIVPPDDIATTIISFEEQLRGWLARLATANSLKREITDYGELKKLLQNYCDLPVVEFDGAAADEFSRLKQLRIRTGTMDLKIAAIALASDALLLSRNLSDFQKVPGLRVEDWSL
jgi:tRNA(fMet)-specific endonuclease VapC